MLPLPGTAKGIRPLARVTPTLASPRCARHGLGPPRRQFHLTALGDAITWTAGSISSVHTAGLPWYLAIPLVAAGVNFSIRLPIMFYTRRLAVRRAELEPLMTAWASRHAAAVPRPASDEAARRTWQQRVATLTEKSRRRILNTWRLQRWKSLAPLLSMVPFIIVSQALRHLCDLPMGWLSHHSGLTSTLSHSSCLADPSLTHGGCLWFVDLTAADPYYALPVLCSALIARVVWRKLSKDRLRTLLTIDRTNAPTSPMSRVESFVGRMFLLFPLVPLLLAHLPSAVFLYWATTFALNDVNRSIVKRLLPHRQPKLTAPDTTTTALPVMPHLRGTDTSLAGK